MTSNVHTTNCGLLYEEVVELTVTFRGSDGRSATAVITCVVMAELSSPLMLGCPTLDKPMMAMTGGEAMVVTRANDVERTRETDEKDVETNGVGATTLTAMATVVKPGPGPDTAPPNPGPVPDAAHGKRSRSLGRSRERS